jgi:plasmid replication initiation protein
MSVQILRKKLRKDRVDGLNMFINLIPAKKGKKIEGTEFNDECGLVEFIA